ncbi:calcium/sodium antiporter [soil metagenome]|nr:calcium/sodium antiporter [Gemmatimonadota bacterium]
MDLLVDLLFFLGGLVALYFGAEWLVGGSSRLATSFGIRPVVVGLTLVAFGTSAPELVVSGLASLRGSGDLAVGNVVGSNIANIALILGISALIRPIRVHPGILVRDVPIMIGFALLFLLVALSGTIGRFEGTALLGLFALYMVHLVRDARQEANGRTPSVAEEEVLELLPQKEISRPREVVLVVLGMVGLVIGAQLLVHAATSVARSLGVSEVIIGLTLVAFGTSVPELAASVVASIRAEAQIVMGNIVGSNIFNIALVLGAAAVLRPLPVDESLLYFETPLMIALSLLLLPFVYKLCLERWEGGVLLAGYAGFLIWIFV